MKPVSLNSEVFTTNRQRLRSLLPENSLVVANSNDVMPSNADGTLGFHPNSDLFYLSGIRQEETLLLLAPQASDEKLREVLFLREPNEALRIWEGHKLSREEARTRSGVKNVKWLTEFRSTFHTLMCEAEWVYLNSNEHYRAQIDVESRDARFIREVQRAYPLHDYRRLARLMRQLRVIKSPAEIEMIRAASALTGQGFRRILNRVHRGVNEREIEAEFAYEFIRHGGRFAYPPIIAAGANNCVLHYNENDQVCQAGQLVLLDVAASLGLYMSDLTRTIPISGRFSRRQRRVYQSVLRCLRHTVKAMVPGKTLFDVRKEAEVFLEKECVDLGLLKIAEIKKQDPDNPAIRKFFMHGVSHPIGLDVHDVLAPGDKLEPGWVLTCEPGLYLSAEGFGIRLENTIRITETGPEDLMADIPIEPDEIESLMK